MSRRSPMVAGRVFPGRPDRGAQRGMVTTELAFAGMGAALAGVVLAWTLTLIGLLIRCQDTAAEVARQLARSDRSAAARAMADRPDGATLKVEQDQNLVSVTVELAARPWAAWLPEVPLSAKAAVLMEPA